MENFQKPTRLSHQEPGSGFRRVGKQLQEIATLKTISIALVLYLAALLALFLADAPIQAIAPDITKPDLHYGYTLAELSEILTAYGPEGRQAYVVSTLVDSVMPAMFALVTLLVVAYLTPRWQGLLSIAPMSFFLLDLVENASFLTMLSQFPDIAPGLARVTSWITIVKLSSYFVALPTLVIGLIVIGIRLLRRRR